MKDKGRETGIKTRKRDRDNSTQSLGSEGDKMLPLALTLLAAGIKSEAKKGIMSCRNTVENKKVLGHGRSISHIGILKEFNFTESYIKHCVYHIISTICKG